MRKLLFAAVVVLAWFGALGTAAQASARPAEEVLRTWYQLVLELVRHTPTYSPPVASRSFAYLGVTAFEAVATGSAEMQSLAGQLNGLTPAPQREAGKTYDEAVVLQAAMAFAVQNFFENTALPANGLLPHSKQNCARRLRRDCLPMWRSAVKNMAARLRNMF